MNQTELGVSGLQEALESLRRLSAIERHLSSFGLEPEMVCETLIWHWRHEGAEGTTDCFAAAIDALCEAKRQTSR